MIQTRQDHKRQMNIRQIQTRYHKSIQDGLATVITLIIPFSWFWSDMKIHNPDWKNNILKVPKDFKTLCFEME